MSESMIGLLSAIAFVSGAVLLSMAFGWQIGVGVALLTWFHKSEP